MKPYETGNPACSTHGLATSNRWPGLCDDGSLFPVAPPPQPTYENIIPDTGYSYDQSSYGQSSYSDSLNKYNQYEVAKVNKYVAPTPKPQPARIIPVQTVVRTQPILPQYTGNKLTDYTFSSFGFNRQPQQQQQQHVVAVTSAPVQRYNFATTQKPVVVQRQPILQQQQQQRPQVKHSAFYTYNWDSLFKNFYSYNTGQ